MKDEYIRKDVALDALKEQADTMRTWVERYAEQRRGVLTSVNIIEDVEPADVVPVVHGKWLPTNDENKKRCNKCDTVVLIAMYPMGNANFCPNCGAKMVE